MLPKNEVGLTSGPGEVLGLVPMPECFDGFILGLDGFPAGAGTAFSTSLVSAKNDAAAPSCPRELGSGGGAASAVGS